MVTKSILDQIICSSLLGKCEVEESNPRESFHTPTQQSIKAFTKNVLKIQEQIIVVYYTNLD